MLLAGCETAWKQKNPKAIAGLGVRFVLCTWECRYEP